MRLVKCAAGGRRLPLLILFALSVALSGENTGDLVEQISTSGQIVEIAATPQERLGPPALIAPGAPPVLGFRTLEGKLRHRFGDLDLVLDDAGH
jgi:hypothetical protein